MKLTAILVLVVAFSQLNQSNAQLLRSYGLKIAVTSASQSYDYYHQTTWDIRPGIDRRIGFNAALYAEWLNDPMFSVITQIEYAQRGFTQEITYVTDHPQATIIDIRNNRFDYLSVPILFKVSAPISGITPYALFGPRLDILVGYRDKFVWSVFSKIDEQFKKTIVGASVGLGVQLNFMRPIIPTIEFRYNVDGINSYDTYALRVRNNAYDLWLGVALCFGNGS